MSNAGFTSVMDGLCTPNIFDDWIRFCLEEEELQASFAGTSC